MRNYQYHLADYYFINPKDNIMGRPSPYCIGI
jgi:hypothetical protein